jgi:hypothetical protein
VEYQRRWNSANPEARKRIKMKNEYGLTMEQHKELLACRKTAAPAAQLPSYSATRKARRDHAPIIITD